VCAFVDKLRRSPFEDGILTENQVVHRLYNQLGEVTRSDANRDQVDQSFTQLSLEGLGVLYCSPTFG